MAYEISEYGERIRGVETEIVNMKSGEETCKRNLKDSLNEIFTRLNKLELTDAKIMGIIIATSTITSIIAAAAVVVIQIYLSRGSP